MKIKVIQISHASHSYFADENDDLKKITLNDWFAKTSSQLKKFYPDIEVECWSPEKLEKHETEFEDSGVKFRFFPTTFSPAYALDFSILMLKALRKEIKENNSKGIETIIHIHEYHSLHGLIIATLFKKQKIIAQNHGGNCPLKYLKEKKKYKKIFLFFLLGQLWENMVLRNIDSFFALSEEEINYLKKISPNSTIKFQTMGIEDIYFKKGNKKLARKKLGISSKKNVVLFLGRITEKKGMYYLLDAMEKLKGTNIELKIGGFGKELKKFEDYSKSKKLENVEFLGGIFGEKKLLYLDSADMLVLPSFNEGAPVVIMEALAKNIPVISTDVGGVSLMIKDGREGIIIKTKSSEEIVRGIKEVLTWKEKNIKRYAEKYKWEKIINHTVKEYLQISP